MARHPGDPAWTLLLDQLRCGSPEFERLWQDGGAFLPGNAPQRFLHPAVGPLRLAPYHLWSEPRPDGLVATGYTPADAATAAKLRTLSGYNPQEPAARSRSIPGQRFQSYSLRMLPRSESLRTALPLRELRVA